jgi:hypothetical protein
VGAIDNVEGQYPVAGGPRAAEAEVGDGVEGGGGSGVPDRGREGVGRLCVVL